MTPLQELLYAGARRAGWALTGASFTFGALALRNPHSPAPEVHVHYPAPPKASPPAPTLVVMPALPGPAPMVDARAPEPRASWSDTDTGACARARASGGILPTSWTTTYVTRQELDRALEDQSALMRNARMVPVKGVDGRIAGIRLFGANAGSYLARLGLESGDLLQTINGYDVTSPEKSLEAYSRLRNADELRVGIVRRGIPMTLVYRIC
ncbi:MAG: hypothetical protein HOO96_42930 [Polyangiaceae bacterium]|nr:hypothetical protein [Polyangiaceae bacterium]